MFEPISLATVLVASIVASLAKSIVKEFFSRNFMKGLMRDEEHKITIAVGDGSHVSIDSRETDPAELRRVVDLLRGAKPTTH